MKRLILDFLKEGDEFVSRIYHPLQDPSSGSTLYSKNSSAFLSTVKDDIVEALTHAPSIEDALKYSISDVDYKGWRYVHSSVIDAYENKMLEYKEEIKKLQEKCQAQST